MSDEWADELTALQSIYDNIVIISETCIEIPFNGSRQSCSLRVELADNYPTVCPNLTLQAFFLSRDEKVNLKDEMLSSFEPGEPVIFTWAEMLREVLVKYDEIPSNEMVERGVLVQSEADLPPVDDDIQIVHGEPIVDRKSTFQASYAKVHCVADAQRFRRKLLRNRKIAGATHNMFVYKVTDNSIVKSDADEDGEHGAGNLAI